MRIVRDLPGLPGERIVYNTDDPADRLRLRNQSALPTMNEVIPRDYQVRPYGSIPDIPPVQDRPEVLIDESDYKERVEEAHQLKQFPVYHQYNSWAPKGEFRYNQNGLGYCWTWGGTGCMMDLMAIHAQPLIPLAPVSMGYLVGWRNRGNYLESFIGGARERGVCPAINGNINDHRNSASVWQEHDDKRKFFRLDMVWDIDTRSGDRQNIKETLSCLVYGCPIYIAYNWWGHALNMSCVFWDESKLHNLICGIRNSHNEDDIILLEGSKMIPDESYAFVTLKIPEESYQQFLSHYALAT